MDHGHPSTYTYNGCRCDLCKAAHLEYQRAYRATVKGRVAMARYRASEKGKATMARWRASDNGKTAVARAYAKRIPRQISFKDKKIIALASPRRGTCSDCGRTRQANERQFAMHHEQYDYSNPVSHTVELCPRCHRQWHTLTRLNPEQPEVTTNEVRSV